MKKLILTLVTVFISVSIYANSDIDIRLCNETGSNSISRSNLRNCDFLSVSNEIWTIQSISIGYVTKDMYRETTSIEKDNLHKFLTEVANSDAKIFYIEKIVIENKTGEAKKLAPKKVKITE